MKVGLIVMLLVLVAGLGYTLTRIWQILPFTNTIKGLLFVIPFMAIASTNYRLTLRHLFTSLEHLGP